MFHEPIRNVINIFKAQYFVSWCVTWMLPFFFLFFSGYLYTVCIEYKHIWTGVCLLHITYTDARLLLAKRIHSIVCITIVWEKCELQSLRLMTFFPYAISFHWHAEMNRSECPASITLNKKNNNSKNKSRIKLFCTAQNVAQKHSSR